MCATACIVMLCKLLPGLLVNLYPVPTCTKSTRTQVNGRSKLTQVLLNCSPYTGNLFKSNNRNTETLTLTLSNAEGLDMGMS